MSKSILDSTKKVLGIVPEYDVFDSDIMMHINSVFSTLNQLGVGPLEGFAIENNGPTWESFLGGDLRLNSVKSYMYIKVRLLFDPPSTSYLINAFEEQAKELEWRISTYREGENWVDSSLVTAVDGGDSA